MGVPKFYRWISERYPCLSEVIKEYQIPEFDNLYLDMNGIIHVCSHPNDDDPHFRITEEKIFGDICHYIDFLFKMIKPQKVFFMAVDGVAPRAKMNQQRGRRFRTARDAVMLEQKARESGELLPTEARFDSNCITPGTEFMARLHTVLTNFVQYKISTDKLWQSIRVILSGHETPGEGEHKIMDFIRYEKSQNNYNPNTRHCLYGLDADLIMLGLCSHEPHFSLLREEVRFGKKSSLKRIMTPEETTFHLLHLSLLREYLEHEFESVKDKIDFEFDVEKIIDDFVLMSFLVGNDFIPHLPQLHIHHDALPVLFRSYMDVLPNLGGYINEDGYLNLVRFETFFKKLAEFDYQKFSEVSEFAPPGAKNDAEIIEDADDTDNVLEKLVGLGFSQETLSKTTEFDSGLSGEDENDFELEFKQHKRHYYRNKLEYDNVTSEVLKDQAEGYVRAIQWNLHYYYNGIASWSWYYPHHYAPFISDVQNFKNMNLDFELGEPFLPFQQLLAVLPSLSKNLLPAAYQKLMIDETSPVFDYYPLDFETDLNGKKQDWEAVVLIPFINEKLLLKCAKEADKTLTPEECQRNQHGPHLLFTYSKKPINQFSASFLPSHFPALESHHAKCQKLPINFYRLSPEKLRKGLCPGVQLDIHFPGFPTLKHIKHSAALENADVKVFQMISQRDNMMLRIDEAPETDIYKIATSLLGNEVHVSWPHLVKAYVVMVSDAESSYVLEDSKPVRKDTEVGLWRSMLESVKEHHLKRLGIILNDVTILIHAKSLVGSRILWDDKLVEEIQWTERYAQYPLNTAVIGLEEHYVEEKIKKTCKDLFPVGSIVFMLGNNYYGCMGTVVDNDIVKNRGSISVRFEIPDEPDMRSVIQNRKKLASLKYVPGYVLAQQLGINGFFLSRITGTFLIQTNSKESISPNRVNVGLNLKFNKKNEEVAGYSKKNEDNQWLYSCQVRETLEKYFTQFPEFFEKLLPLTEQDIVYLEDMYDVNEGKEIMKDISNWLKSQQCTTAERQACGLNTLDEGIVTAIEEVVNNTIKSAGKVNYKNIFVKPAELYNPHLCKGCIIPDCKASYQLFDRVINVRHTITVPLGLRGTVIGIKEAERLCDYVYEVVFDEEFFGGIKLHCSPGRGYHMPPSALMNLSYGDRLLGINKSPRKKLNLSYLKSQIDNHFENNASMNNQNVDKNDETAINNELSPQIRILHKDNSLYEGYKASSNQPFYKNKSLISPNAANPSSGFLPKEQSSSSSQNVFITPKASQSSGRVGKPQSSEQAEYNTFWDGLLNKSSPVKPTPVSESKQFGQSVTVQELFSAFENHKMPHKITNNAQFLSHPPLPPQQAAATVRLMNWCTHTYGSPPTYMYQKLAVNSWYIATVVLPDGRKFISIQSSTKEEAAENAAEKALPVLNMSHHNFNANPFPKKMDNKNFNTVYHPPQWYNFSPPRHPFQPAFGPGFSNSPNIRYPAVPVPFIPESFVKQNQLILAGQNSTTQVKHFIPSRTLPILNHSPEVKNTTNQKDKLKSKENVFIPLQALRNSTKEAKDKGGASLQEEWPPLPASTSSQSDKNDTDALPKTPIKSEPENNLSLKSCSKEILKQNTTQDKPKSRKTRIAAMIPNLSK